MGKIKIIDIIDENGKKLEKVTCNTPNCLIHCDIDTCNWEHLYRKPE